eukprot:scaffold653057_cov46-Prasinocladus_malaysianus.AAC.1
MGWVVAGGGGVPGRQAPIGALPDPPGPAAARPVWKRHAGGHEVVPASGRRAPPGPQPGAIRLCSPPPPLST